MSNRLALVSLGTIFGFGLSGIIIDNYYAPYKIQQTPNVQEGYAIPSKLGINLQDLDGNGQKEVLMNYDGRSYLLTLDGQGMPRVQAYDVKPTEVLKKE